MKSLESLIDDPIIQLLIMVIIAIGVFDAFKFALEWVWKKLGGGDDEVR